MTQFTYEQAVENCYYQYNGNWPIPHRMAYGPVRYNGYIIDRSDFERIADKKQDFVHGSAY